MGIDNSTLLRQTAQDIVRGLRSERGAFADLVCTKKVRDSIKGSEPFRSTKDMLARDVAGEAIGADPTFINKSMSSIDWDLQRYHRGIALDASEIQDLNQYFDALGEYTENLMEHVDLGIDLDLVALLEDSNFNDSQAAANGNWSVSTSTPVEDMQAICRDKVPGADTVIVGFQTAQELSRHPDLKERFSNYEGGGALAMPVLRNAIAEVCMVAPASVFIMTQFYDAANPAQALSITYKSGTELFWVGTRRALVMVEQPYPASMEGMSNEGVVTVDQKHLNYEVVYSRTLDLIRPDSQSGAYMTGI